MRHLRKLAPVFVLALLATAACADPVGPERSSNAPPAPLFGVGTSPGPQR